MAQAALGPDEILDAAEDLLRRFGPHKTTVVDVARALGVSHASLYRHFAGKAALRDAVARRWLARLTAPLDALAAAAPERPAPERLRGWLTALCAAKRAKVLDDPLLFATYSGLVGESREVVAEHVGHLVATLAAIIAQGIAEGRFAPTDPTRAARAVLAATARFHHPAHAAEWRAPAIEAERDAVLDLVLAGLAARPG